MISEKAACLFFFPPLWWSVASLWPLRSRTDCAFVVVECQTSSASCSVRRATQIHVAFLKSMCSKRQRGIFFGKARFIELWHTGPRWQKTLECCRITCRVCIFSDYVSSPLSVPSFWEPPLPSLHLPRCSWPASLGLLQHTQVTLKLLLRF